VETFGSQRVCRVRWWDGSGSVVGARVFKNGKSLFFGAGMQITEEWIKRFTTPRGAWTRRQLAAIRVPWPPPRGWIHRAVGQHITEAERLVFEAGAGVVQAPELPLRTQVCSHCGGSGREPMDA